MILRDKEINLVINPPREDYTWEPMSDQNTEKLPDDVWLKLREHGPHYDDPTHPDYVDFAFGGSSQGAICNMESAFGSRLELYHQKIGIKPAIEKDEDDTILRLGHIYERTVGEKFKLYMEKKHPDIRINLHYYKKIARCLKKKPDGTLASPYCVMNVDGLLEVTNVLGESALLLYEAKTIHPFNKKKIKMVRKGIVPEEYRAQIAYYMYGMNLPAAVIVFSWGHTMEDMAIIWVERDYDFEEWLIQQNDELYHCLQTKTEPDITKMPKKQLVSYFGRLFKVPEKEKILKLPSSYEADVKKAIEFQKKREELEKEIADLKNKEAEHLALVAQYFGVATKAVYEIDEFTTAEIVLMRSMTREKIDEERFKKEQPELFEKYKKEPELDFSKMKKCEDRDVFEDYVIPSTINPKPGKGSEPHFVITLKDREV